MTTNDLRPCPFCGRTQDLKVTTRNAFWVRCWHCNAHGPEGGTKDDAVAQWNVRRGPGKGEVK